MIQIDGIGNIVGTDYVSVATNTLYSAYEFNLKRNGIYLAIANVYWSANENGYRELCFSVNETIINSYRDIRPGAGFGMFHNLPAILNGKTTDNYAIKVRQNSGSDIKIVTRITLVYLGNN